MWPFSTNPKTERSGVLQHFTDWHCHILPGVDDGVQTPDESLAILRRYEQAGVREVWFTPHIMEDFPNTNARLTQRFGELRAAYKGPLRLHLAAEYMLDNLFMQRLEARELLPIGPSGNHLLVETSYFRPPMRLHEMLRAIRSAGYMPVLAHPERYAYMCHDDYVRLKEEPILFQLNLSSLVGMYGKHVQSKAAKFLQQGWYGLCGTDIHRIGMMERLWKSPISKKLIPLVENLRH